MSLIVGGHERVIVGWGEYELTKQMKRKELTGGGTIYEDSSATEIMKHVVDKTENKKLLSESVKEFIKSVNDYNNRPNINTLILIDTNELKELADGDIYDLVNVLNIVITVGKTMNVGIEDTDVKMNTIDDGSNVELTALKNIKKSDMLILIIIDYLNRISDKLKK